MPLDRRLRGTFDRAGEAIDPDVDARLAATVERAGARQGSLPTGLLAAAALVLVVVFAGPRLFGPNGGVGGGPTATPASTATPTATSPDPVAGTWTVTLASTDPGVADLGAAGTWTLTLQPDGALDLVTPPTFTGSRASGHTFSLDGETLRTDLYYNDYCSSVGAYTWTRSASQLTLASTSDTCAIRQAILATHPWTVVEPGGSAP